MGATDSELRRAYPSDELLRRAGIERKSGPTGDIVMYLASLNDNDNGFSWIADEIVEYNV